jgi:hypothetical protein
MMFVADLPLPPSTNGLFTEVTIKGKVRRITSKPYKAWKTEAGRLLRDQWEAAGRPIIDKPYAIHISLNVNHQSDIFNREKALTDLFVATIPGFPDDCWINQGVVTRDRTIEAARVEVVSLP